MAKLRKDTQNQSKGEKQPTTRDRILDAALSTFIENGYARATTRLIAANAGVTEVTLFRHFESKEILFLETAQRYSKISDLLQALENGRGNDLTNDLLNFAHVIMDTFIQRQGIMRLVLSEADHHPEVRNAVAEGPRALRRFLTEYFQDQINAGRIRAIKTDLAASQFLGIFLSLILTQDLMGDFAELETEKSQVISSIVDIFIQGINNP